MHSGPCTDDYGGEAAPDYSEQCSVHYTLRVVSRVGYRTVYKDRHCVNISVGEKDKNQEIEEHPIGRNDQQGKDVVKR
jgi:hypothetical protein